MRHLVVLLALLCHCATAAGPNDLSLSQASNAFASRLYQELAKTPGNVLVCPVSAHIALALVHQGAGGGTESELATVLRLPSSSNDIRNGYKALLSGLQDDVLKIATKLYPAISFKPKPDYVSVAQQYFLSDAQALDYGKAVDAAKTINKFVESKTNNKIHDIIKSDSLTDLTRLIIVNAVHFKAGWAKTFPPATIDNFKVTPTETVKTEFLSKTDYYPFKEDPALGAKVLKMDYENGTYSMVFVLPTKEDGLPELERKLAGTSMDSLLSGLKEVRVEVTIPKFKIEQEIQLKDVLTKMGIVSMFTSRADLSKIAQGENLYVDSVIQKTFIDVNEKGTEAAAATGVITPLSGGSEEFTFSARRPFHFYLVHSIHPLVILFNGRLVQPQEKVESSPDDEQEVVGDSNKINIGHNYNSYPNIPNKPQTNKPNIGHGQTINQQNAPQNKQPNIGHGQTINQQSAPQNKQPNIGHGQAINQQSAPQNKQPNIGHGQNINQQNVPQNKQPNIGHGQTINQQNVPYNYGQNRPINSFDQNTYHGTQTQPSNYGQNFPEGQLSQHAQQHRPQHFSTDPQQSFYQHHSYQPWDNLSG